MPIQHIQYPMIDSMSIDLICVRNVQCGNAFRFPINVNNFTENLHQNRTLISNKITSFSISFITFRSQLVCELAMIGFLCVDIVLAHKISTAHTIAHTSYRIYRSIASMLIDTIFFVLLSSFNDWNSKITRACTRFESFFGMKAAY